ncbi:CheR family methyltransferase [Salidesulfovibrio onnuriiensis]|uniref:CheR family methyltransferase n=1 Tax=Salidesulfovibrio onnuriiensis TaxID=2583823 RepID=UPI00202AF62A|nr:CheR family methyltransferase [Salidesulfovibrio onnuriiensis]
MDKDRRAGMVDPTVAAGKIAEAARASRSMCMFKTEMGDSEFERFSKLIHSEFGIKMPPSKKVLLQSRFQKRLRALGLQSYQEYCEYVFSPEGQDKERQHLVDVVTTNTTHFFREPKHYDILNEMVLPAVWKRHGTGKEILVWSAGCSSGEEPYTLAMVLSEFADRCQGFRFSILATDISREILQKAMRAVYALEKADEIPQEMKKKYVLKSKNPEKRLIKMDKLIRNRIRFSQLNFMENFRLQTPQDIIFCRNVVIYFDRATQEVLFSKFCDNLNPGGYLFIGHSESLSGMKLPLRQLAPTVFQRI